MLNRIFIHGRLTWDPEIKNTKSGVPMCKFAVAVDRDYNNGEEKAVDFFNCTAWRGLAEMIAKYFHKGKEILLSGEMQSYHWIDDDGNNKTGWGIQVASVDFCGSKGDNAKQEDKPGDPEGYKEIYDDELPF